jgi:hypothetical protein
MAKIVAMHQPNYIPWLGYFYKMAKCDVFVYLDQVQFPRGRSFSARNKIKTPKGAELISIPISIPQNTNSLVTYNEVSFSDAKWSQKHLKTIQFNYKKAVYFDEIYSILTNTFEDISNLVELNINLIEAIKSYLNIKTKTVRVSELFHVINQKNELIIDICGALEAEIYLSGEGAKSYNDEILLNKNRIKLLYTDFKHPVYKQLWGDFIPNLSIIDLLFNYGPESKSILLTN